MRILFAPPPQGGVRPAIFLDRDGIINQRLAGDYIREWRQFRFVRGIKRLALELTKFRMPVIVVSNQAAVGKGLMATSALETITRRFVAELANSGARIDAVYYCLHRIEEACDCRKPRPGLLLQAAEDWKIELRRSVLIGDSITDVKAAQSAECNAILLATKSELANASAQNAGVLAVARMADIAGCVRRLLQ